MCRQNEKGFRFTLVELLVVISIISILAAMLLPALERARDAALQTKCMGSQRQVMLGILMYSNESDSLYQIRNYNSDIFALGGDAGWLHTLYVGEYLPTDEVLICPKIERTVKFDSRRCKITFGCIYSDSSHNPVPWQFTQNSPGVGLTFINLMQMQKPSCVMLGGDSYISDGALKGNQYSFMYLFERTSTMGFGHARHNGSLNMMFGDGHVESIIPDMFMDKYVEGGGLSSATFWAYPDDSGSVPVAFPY